MERVSRRLLAISWATLPMSAPRAMQVSRLLASVAAEGWRCDVVTSWQSANPPAETAELRIARHYEKHYAVHVARRAVKWRDLRVSRNRSAAPNDETDMGAPWIASATRLALRLSRQNRFDALATFAQPWSDHLIGLRIKRSRPTLPWIAHFSDPWVDSPYMDSLKPAERAAMAAQEEAVINAADAVMFVTQQTADMVMRKYDSRLQQKVHVLQHCLDRSILPSPAAGNEPRRKDRLRIVHTGSLYGGIRPATALLQALATLRQQDPALPLEICFVGYNPENMRRELGAHGLDDIVRLSAPCSWSESLSIAQSADLLLIIDRPAAVNLFLPSKAIEYLALDKPIMALTPASGATADLMRDLGYPIAPPDDPAAVAACLSARVELWRRGALQRSESHEAVSARYDARAAAKSFAATLFEVIGAAQQSHLSLLTAPWSTARRDRTVTGNAPAAGGPASDAMAPDESETYKALQSILRIVGNSNEQVTLVLLQRVSTAELELVQSHARVASLMINWVDPSFEARHRDRLGFFQYGSSMWVLPKVKAGTLAIVGYVDSLGVWRTLDAIRHGVRRVIVQSPFMGIWQITATPILLVQTLFRRLEWSFYKLVARWQDQNSPLSLESSLARRMRSALKEARPALSNLDNYAPGRIVLVSGSLDAGGAERQVVNTAVSLVEGGLPDVSILCRTVSTGSMEFFRSLAERHGVRVGEIPQFLHAELEAIVGTHRQRLPRILRHLPNDIAAEILMLTAEFLLRRPQVVHAWQDYINVIAGLAAAIAGVPKIILGGRSVAPYHFVFHQPYMRGAYQALMELPNVVMTTNSQAGAEDYAAWLTVPRSRIKVIPNGYDFRLTQRRAPADVARYRRSLGIDPGRRLVGTIMRFSEEKRPLLWIEAAAKVAARRSDVSFLMAGTGTMHDEATALARTLGIEDRIAMPGIEKDAMLALSAMDMFVLTSRKEGLPNTLIEAQAVGVPVITTNAGGAGEAFLPGRTGRLVDADSSDAIAAEILWVLDHPDWHAQAAARAPAFVHEKFSQERLRTEMLGLYDLGTPGDRDSPAQRPIAAGER